MILQKLINILIKTQKLIKVLLKTHYFTETYKHINKNLKASGYIIIG